MSRQSPVRSQAAALFCLPPHDPYKLFQVCLFPHRNCSLIMRVPCRDLYECSCEELDTLIAECKKQGALGSRLTGAGWGGCTVSLIKQADAAHFITAIKSNYFEKCIKDGKVKSDQLEEVIFASKPASGGAIIKLQM